MFNNEILQVILIGATVHAGLIFNAVFQNAFIISQGLTKRSPYPLVMVFIISSFLSSFLGIYGVHHFVNESEWLQKTIGILGASILFYTAINSFVRARKDHYHPKKAEGILVTVSMVWLTPHIYLDMVAIGAVGATISPENYPFLIAGFSGFAMIWFFGLAFFTQKVSVLYSNKKVHKAMHYIASLVLFVIAINVLIETFVPHGDHNHGAESEHMHTSETLETRDDDTHDTHTHDDHKDDHDDHKD